MSATEVGTVIVDLFATEKCENCGTPVTTAVVEYDAEADRRQTWWESVQGGSEHTPDRCRAFRAANGQGSR